MAYLWRRRSVPRGTASSRPDTVWWSRTERPECGSCIGGARSSACRLDRERQPRTRRARSPAWRTDWASSVRNGRESLRSPIRGHSSRWKPPSHNIRHRVRVLQRGKHTYGMKSAYRVRFTGNSFIRVKRWTLDYKHMQVIEIAKQWEFARIEFFIWSWLNLKSWNVSIVIIQWLR